MAWIESHQTLASHPKTRKAARALGIPPVHLIGHLHCLWHWALDLAEDGDLSKFDVDDIAIAAQWDGDSNRFVDALLTCGFGDGPGFLERNGSYGDPADGLIGELVLHDWWAYAGKLVARRQQDRRRKAARRATDVPEDVQRTSDGSPADVQRTAGSREPDPTEPNQPSASSRKRADRATRIPDGWTPKPEPDLVEAVGGQRQADRELERFRDYWAAQAGQKGRKVDWQATWRNWLRRAADDRQPSGSTDPPKPRHLVVGSPEWEARRAEELRREEEMLGA